MKQETVRVWKVIGAITGIVAITACCDPRPFHAPWGKPTPVYPEPVYSYWIRGVSPYNPRMPRDAAVVVIWHNPNPLAKQ